jgi:hypothetical protein
MKIILYPFINVYKYFKNDYLKINRDIASGKGNMGFLTKKNNNTLNVFHTINFNFINAIVYKIMRLSDSRNWITQSFRFRDSVKQNRCLKKAKYPYIQPIC